MSLLYDARRIQNGGAIDVNGRCYFCGYDLAGADPHAPDCPWPSMPQIMATLEAAERTISAYDKPDDRETFWREFWALEVLMRGISR